MFDPDDPAWVMGEYFAGQMFMTRWQVEDYGKKLVAEVYRLREQIRVGGLRSDDGRGTVGYSPDPEDRKLPHEINEIPEEWLRP